MSAPSLELLAAAGLSFEASERALLIPCANAPVDLLLVRPHDIPEYVQDGVVHAGITGANLVVEAGRDVGPRGGAGVSPGTLGAPGPGDAPPGGHCGLGGPRGATAYALANPRRPHG